MTRTYTLTIEEYRNELSKACPSWYRQLVACAKQVSDSEVKLIIESEGR